MDSPSALRLARKLARREGLSPYRVRVMARLFAACLDRRKLFPRRILQRNPKPGKDYVAAWVKAYSDGIRNTGLARKINPMGTTPDPIITMMIQAYEGVSKSAAEIQIVHHRTAMKHENLVGDLLEEYVAVRLDGLGWLCAWGSTIQHVDFMGPNGELLQVKNRDNTESAAGRSVRKDRNDITKWHRLISKTGSDRWEKLRSIVQAPTRMTLSESDFHDFVRTTLSNIKKGTNRKSK